MINEKLNKIYEVRSVDLNSAEPIADDINTLIILGPNTEFSEEQLKKIDGFFIKGKSLLALVDGITIDNNLISQKNDIKLDTLLNKYGVKLNQDLVLDESSAIATFSHGFLSFTTSYPYWPSILRENFDSNNIATIKLESLVMPWVSSLEINKDLVNPENTISYLVKTTERSWKKDVVIDVNPQQMLLFDGEPGSRNVAVSISGKFKSAYQELSTDNGNLIVVGDSDFGKDRFAKQFPENLIFLQNLVDSVSLDKDLISIRSKGITNRPINEVSDIMKVVIRYVNIFGVTIVVLLFGVIRYYLRKRSRFIDKL